MAITLPPLPFDPRALEPHMSARTLEFHHGKHHQSYVDKTNELIAGTDYERLPLAEIVRRAHAAGDDKLFNQAGQAWNHDFLWQSLSPDGGAPEGRLKDLVNSSFGGFAEFGEAFKEKAVDHFASGWAWLCTEQGKLVVLTTHDADTPLVADGVTPLVTLDLWEHAYYLDHQNARPDFVDAFLKHMINWDFAAQNLAAAPDA
ncbi:MAG: superoxide dismutase [Novosphingobium sp.]